ncbi:MAG: tRNA (guanosine(37)-N1)-methyltransferase TrmD [Actinobacteria bacterium]|nr:tRNA (guanosine(37)-N1)-methyltransferase TrmD [Actinomycetota bacterium]
MRIDVITIFPEFFEGPFSASLLGRASAAGTVELHVHDLRGWTDDRHRTVDDAPYGGGAGMVMRADVWFRAAEAVWGNDAPQGVEGPRPRTIVLTPRGRLFDHDLAQELAAEARLVLCCGRYEGIDERVHDVVATDEVSIGDYVLAGGEVAAAVIVEAVTRLVPGVMGNEASPEDESFRDDLLEYPQYTRPAEIVGHRVPDVLLSGDHGAIAAWRREQAEAITRRRRPDLWDRRGGSSEDLPPSSGDV